MVNMYNRIYLINVNSNSIATKNFIVWEENQLYSSNLEATYDEEILDGLGFP